MYIHCEDSEAQSQVVRETFNPLWNAEFIFYRTEPRKNPVVIQVSNKYYYSIFFTQEEAIGLQVHTEKK